MALSISITKNRPDTDNPINLVVVRSLINTKTKMSDECSMSADLGTCCSHTCRPFFNWSHCAGEPVRGTAIWFPSADYISASDPLERTALLRNYFDATSTREAKMPVILVPVLWVGGAIVLLGGGWYVVGHMVH
jgi:hypothetical protein